MTDPIVLPFYQVDAFSSGRPLTGNPAAVMPLDGWLPDEILQAIAAENNLSETAFTVPSEGGDADYELRWFTPTTEVELCGHATIASGHVLIHGDRVRFSTRSGILTVSRNGDLLELDLPAYETEQGELPGLQEALGTDGDLFISESGNNSAIVLLVDEEAVRAVRPDFRKLKVFDRLVMVTAPAWTSWRTPLATWIMWRVYEGESLPHGSGHQSDHPHPQCQHTA